MVDGLENADRGLDHRDVQPAFVRLQNDLLERLAHVQLEEIGLELVGDVLAALQVRIELGCVFVVVCVCEGGESRVDEETARGEEGGLHDGGAFRREKAAIDERKEVGEGKKREIIGDRGDGEVPIEGYNEREGKKATRFGLRIEESLHHEAVVGGGFGDGKKRADRTELRERGFGDFLSKEVRETLLVEVNGERRLRGKRDELAPVAHEAEIAQRHENLLELLDEGRGGRLITKNLVKEKLQSDACAFEMIQ